MAIRVLAAIGGISAGWNIVFAAILGLPGSAAAAGEQQELALPLGNRPNVVLIITDDQGYGDLSCHGNPILKTPHLDRLHAASVRFTDFQVSPTCSPTRCALMTGKHEFRSGVTHTILERERMSPRAVTLPQVLKSVGYTTGIFGKWHLGDEPEYQPDRRGFDEVFIHGAGGIGQTYPGSCGDAPGNGYFDPAILHNGKFVKTRGYCTDVFFRQATQWIEQQKGRKPFFAYISTNAPHDPLIVPEQYEQLYAGRVPEKTAKYWGMIANIDENVGRLLDQLKHWGIERETLVVFMNDNGGTHGCKIFNAGMKARKGTMWLGGTRATSFWSWPGKLKSGDANRLAAHIDVLPTLAELAGAKIPAEAGPLDGRSLAPLLTNPSADWPDRYLITHVGRWPKGAVIDDFQYVRAAVRNTDYSLVFTSPEEIPQLFDLRNDYGQQKNIAEAHPEVVARLKEQYDRWWREVRPCLNLNEAAQGPPINPFKKLYWEQFPDERPKSDGSPATRGARASVESSDSSASVATPVSAAVR